MIEGKKGERGDCSVVGPKRRSVRILFNHGPRTRTWGRAQAQPIREVQYHRKRVKVVLSI